MQGRSHHQRHPGIDISSISYHPLGSQNPNRASKSRKNSLKNSRVKRRSNNASNFKKNRSNQHKSLKHNSKRRKKENLKGNSEAKDNQGIQFDSKGYGRSLRNSYYLMHHKQKFYQTLMKDNSEFEKNFSRNLEETDAQMNRIYKGEQPGESNRDIYKRGLTDEPEKRKYKANLDMNRKSKNPTRPVKMSMQVINSELRNFSRNKPKRKHEDSEFVRELNRRTLQKKARDNEMVTNITVGILRKEIEKNLKELEKTHKKLVEVEQGKEFSKPTLKTSPSPDPMTSSKLFSLNKGLKRPATRIHLDKDVLLLNPDSKKDRFSGRDENDYLNSVLNKELITEPDEKPLCKQMMNQNKLFSSQGEQKQNLQKMNQKVEDKTFIRGLLGTVGKSHLAEDFFDKKNPQIKQNPNSLAQELYDSIKIKQKFDHVRQKENSGFFGGPVATREPLNFGRTNADLKQSLRFDAYGKANLHHSSTLQNTQNNMNYYLNSVLKGGKQNFDYSAQGMEPYSEKTGIFNYLNSLQNTFDLKSSLKKTNKNQYSGIFKFIFEIDNKRHNLEK